MRPVAETSSTNSTGQPVSGEIIHPDMEGLALKCIREHFLTTNIACLIKQYQEALPKDICIRAATKTFRANRKFLIVRCPGLKLGTQAKDKSSGLNFSEFDDDIVGAVLDYVYNAETDLLMDPTKVPGLLECSRRFGMDGLKRDCESVLRNALKPTVDTVLENLLRAHKAKMEDMKIACLEFFHENARAVQHSKSYRKHLESSDAGTLFGLITEYIAVKGPSTNEQSK